METGTRYKAPTRTNPPPCITVTSTLSYDPIELAPELIHILPILRPPPIPTQSQMPYYHLLCWSEYSLQLSIELISAPLDVSLPSRINNLTHIHHQILYYFDKNLDPQQRVHYLQEPELQIPPKKMLRIKPHIEKLWTNANALHG